MSESPCEPTGSTVVKTFALLERKTGTTPNKLVSSELTGSPFLFATVRRLATGRRATPVYVLRVHFRSPSTWSLVEARAAPRLHPVDLSARRGRTPRELEDNPLWVRRASG